MNRQRKVLITITYNEMGIIIDTKAEEVAQPNLQPTCNQLATDTISRQAAIDVAKEELENGTFYDIPGKIEVLPPAQPERKKGTYTESGENDEWYCWYATCNECGKEWMGSRNFCPNCGADMR